MAVNGTSTEKPVIIIGAGVVGLTLAHGLVKANIPFEIYERDEHVDSRDQGWAITLHWCLAFLRKILSEENLALLEASQVDPDVAKNDTGNFLFLNLATLETKFRIPPNDRRRVRRDRFRKALLADERVSSRVRWGKRLEDIEVLDGGDGGVRANFSGVSGVNGNGSATTAVEGKILIGAEGTNSRTRKFLAPETYKNNQLDVKLLGAGMRMTPEQAQPIRDIDPLLFQGCQPDTNDFLWISILDTPASNGSENVPGDEHYTVQVILSWPVKHPEDAEMPATDALRAAEVKRRAAQFHPTLKTAIDCIPDDGSLPVREIEIQDWPCLPWDNRGGNVTLVGDAAHAMTMFRGEAANHGIMDAFNLIRALEEIYAGRKTTNQAIDAYEEEMRERTTVAVMWSREACIGAHDYHGLNEKSAVLRRRAIRPPDQ